MNRITVQGCFKKPKDDKDPDWPLEFVEIRDYNEKAGCSKTCTDRGLPVAATSGGNECYCGKMYPAQKFLVDDSKCNQYCTGYDWEACGGIGTFTVYNTGKTVQVEYAGDDEEEEDEEDSKPASTTTTAPQTTQFTPPPGAQSSAPSEEEKQSSGGGTNTAGIAAGVVVGVVVIAGAVGGVFLYLRRKRNKEIEEEHRRNAAVNAFIGKPPGSSGSMSAIDSRMDPTFAARRMSDGSIADNQDYSRRILRVTNA